jgi:hypothetical protein
LYKLNELLLNFELTPQEYTEKSSELKYILDQEMILKDSSELIIDNEKEDVNLIVYLYESMKERKVNNDFVYLLEELLCSKIKKEVFGEKIPEVLDDEEAMSTISKFFDNNLNISETARQLYVHRNTLVYRLERIEKEIGLDIRKFDDAMTFRIAVMVLAHVKDADSSK